MKAYKVFNSDWTCRDFLYEDGDLDISRARTGRGLVHSITGVKENENIEFI